MMPFRAAPISGPHDESTELDEELARTATGVGDTDRLRPDRSAGVADLGEQQQRRAAVGNRRLDEDVDRLVGERVAPLGGDHARHRVDGSWLIVSAIENGIGPNMSITGSDQRRQSSIIA
jgi:hypothetical protein